jgi:hypothetical protein
MWARQARTVSGGVDRVPGPDPGVHAGFDRPAVGQDERRAGRGEHHLGPVAVHESPQQTVGHGSGHRIVEVPRLPGCQRPLAVSTSRSSSRSRSPATSFFSSAAARFTSRTRAGSVSAQSIRMWSRIR